MARPRTTRSTSAAERASSTSAERLRYGQVLRFACLARQISPQEFSKAIGVSLKSVRRWFTGQAKPRRKNHANAFALLHLNDETFQSLARLIERAGAILDPEPSTTSAERDNYLSRISTPPGEIAEGHGLWLQVEAWVRSMIRKELAERGGDR
jgi:DNA-binding transcriptional regulator YiaG